jgi:uncharacterized protein (UPF0332 family)
MRAVLALDEVDMSKHSGIMAEFRKRYLKTEILDRKLSATISQAFEVRNASDYDDFYIVAREDVDLQIDKATQFIIAIGAYLAAQGARLPER